MIFLEQTVNQILREEGQLVVSPEDLGITWETFQDVFVATFEQAKGYITIYDWVNDSLSIDPKERAQYSHIKHINYNPLLGFQRIMPDVPHNYWEYNPYTNNASAIMNANFSLDVQKFATIDYIDYTIQLDCKKERKTPFILPCSFEEDTFSFKDMVAYPDYRDKKKVIIEGDNGVGTFDSKKLMGHIILDEDYSGTLKVTSKYLGIKELDLNNAEIFYVWFKANILCMLGAMKETVDLQGIGLPFNINADTLLARGRQLLDHVETLKGTKSHWSNF